MRWGRPLLRLAALVVCTATLGAAGVTDGTLDGEVVILDRGGAARSDLTGVIAYLDPMDGAPRSVASGPADEASIVMRGKEFLPHTAVIRAGGTVRFPNADPFSHNVFSNTERHSFDLGLYRRGSTRGATFAQPGVYPIYCNIHAKMVSYVIAVPDRYVAFANNAGRFTIANIPPGTYRLHVWHERAPLVTQTITVAQSAVDVRITLDARGYVSGTHLNKFGAPYGATRSDRY